MPAEKAEERGRQELMRITYEAQVVQQQLQALQQQLAALQMSIEETDAALNTISGIKEVEGEALVPMGAGAFAKAKITDKDKVLVDIGARILVEKSAEDATKFFNERLEKMREAREGLTEAVTELQARLQGMDKRAQELVSKMRGSDVQPPEE